ncbi:MAG: CoA transferase [Alphaproteobacteria bacterium]|jgi:crotonobetainyl-CoA:carnitine CoA-transferase CaiB-like acyl-CoA transferase|nr:CoA transferase [Alphaproteobacteria bacterium]PPR13793.1 MAG: Succinyl-CoA--L-malate CoA-transferase beta subunit [Alphaproteobacteria bacterium MarineAlpha12_Bin1]|tara:strand:- start:5930 stop:7138 length:1209 start_codon:yes stop_codon:yes gene_type:complete
MSKDKPQPLQGLKVIECATVIAAPLCGRMLADFGAEVIHIEHPEKGDDLRHFGFTDEGVNPWWKYYSRNKKLITLNISKPQGRSILMRLIEDADVLIENFRPGRLEEWNIHYDELTKINPRLIMVRVSGFGQTGPYSNQPGFGTLIEAMSGFAHLTGDPEGPPMLPQFALADSFAGCYATMATMFAIYHRDIFGAGKGQIIDVSLWESLFSMLGPNAMVSQLTGQPPMRTGNRTITSAPRNLYRTKDNRWVALAGSTPATAIRLFNAIGQPNLATDPRFKSNKDRLENVVELDKVINEWTKSHSLDEVTTIFRQHLVPVGPVFDVNDIMNNLHAIFREMVVEIPDKEGLKLKMEGVFPKMVDTPGKIQHAGKSIGDDNDEIFKKRLNIPDSELLELKNKKII